jgi:hypothetical protein
MKVVIDNEVYRKIMFWVNKSSYEVSGLGTVTYDEAGIFRVTSAMLLPQKNGSTHTDIEGEDVSKLMYALRASPGDLRFWWHSHVDMPVFWSGTDMDTIKKIGAGGWFLSTVFNKKNEMRSAFYAVEGNTTPWGKQPFFHDELDTSVAPIPETNSEAWDEEYRLNVTNIRHATAHFDYGDNRRHWGYESEDFSGPHHEYIARQRSGNNSARPPNMSKKAWKKLKREQRAEPPALSIAMPDELDAYGFTQEERAFLAQIGWEENDFDELYEMDVTPSEMLQFASFDILPSEISDMLQTGWTVTDLLRHFEALSKDTPVMDAANGGKYDS